MDTGYLNCLYLSIYLSIYLSLSPKVCRSQAEGRDFLFCVVLHAPMDFCHWEGLCTAAPFTAGGDCPPGFRASGRRPGSRRTAVAPSTPAAAASYARRRHHPLKWACDSNAQSSAMRAVHCHTASRGRWIRKACKFPRTEKARHCRELGTLQRGFLLRFRYLRSQSHIGLWEEHFGFTCDEERAAAYAATGERLVWVPKQERDFEKVERASGNGLIYTKGEPGRGDPSRVTASPWAVATHFLIDGPKSSIRSQWRKELQNLAGCLGNQDPPNGGFHYAHRYTPCFPILTAGVEEAEIYSRTSLHHQRSIPSGIVSRKQKPGTKQVGRGSCMVLGGWNRQSGKEQDSTNGGCFPLGCWRCVECRFGKPWHLSTRGKLCVWRPRLW